MPAHGYHPSQNQITEPSDGQTLELSIHYWIN